MIQIIQEIHFDEVFWLIPAPSYFLNQIIALTIINTIGCKLIPETTFKRAYNE